MEAKQIKKHKILIIDHEIKDIELIEIILNKNEYIFESALSGKEALEKINHFTPDLIFLDILLPEIDGYEVCRKLKAHPQINRVPIIIVTTLTDEEYKIKALEANANEFLTKPIDETELLVRTKNLLKIKEYEDFINKYNQILKKKVLEKTQKLKDSYIDTVLRLTKVAEFKDEDTTFHIKRTGYYCKHIAENLGWSEENIDAIFYASPMHDIGKIGIPAEILLKTSALTNLEFTLMQTHTTIGHSLLSNSTSKIIQMASSIALSHHERWNGDGYPNRLKKEQIPIEGRIMIVADQYDALRSRRPYKDGYDHQKVFRIMTEGDGKSMPNHFDPKILEIFKDTHKIFQEIFDANNNLNSQG